MSAAFNRTRGTEFTVNPKKMDKKSQHRNATFDLYSLSRLTGAVCIHYATGHVINNN